MRTEALVHRWVVLLGATLLAAGCVTLPPQPAGTFPLQWSARGWGSHVVMASAGERPPRGAATQGPPTCGGRAVPPGWPDFPSGDGEALLAPFLACSSPAEFLALQEGVDMPRLVEALDDWRAVRLGALGPVREEAVPVLQRKRAAFLLSATERYGLLYAEVFALFVLHSAHDDEVEELLRWLARDKQLGQTLALMPAVREELEARGLPLSRYPDRAERAGDVPRGLVRAARDVLSTSPGAQRRYLGDFDKPRIEKYVGVRKPDTGLRFVDVLVIEEGELTGGPRRVETFSFKSRDLSGLGREALRVQMIEDTKEALRKYGETLNIRRDSLQPFLRGGSEVPVQRIRLIYEGGDLKPRNVDDLKAVVNETRTAVPGVEVLFQ